MLTELCSCYSLCGDFIVFDHIVVPTEFLISQLETRLSEYVMGWLYMHTAQKCHDWMSQELEKRWLDFFMLHPKTKRWRLPGIYALVGSSPLEVVLSPSSSGVKKALEVMSLFSHLGWWHIINKSDQQRASWDWNTCDSPPFSLWVVKGLQKRYYFLPGPGGLRTSTWWLTADSCLCTVVQRQLSVYVDIVLTCLNESCMLSVWQWDLQSEQPWQKYFIRI